MSKSVETPLPHPTTYGVGWALPQELLPPVDWMLTWPKSHCFIRVSHNILKRPSLSLHVFSWGGGGSDQVFTSTQNEILVTWLLISKPLKFPLVPTALSPHLVYGDIINLNQVVSTMSIIKCWLNTVNIGCLRCYKYWLWLVNSMWLNWVV